MPTLAYYYSIGSDSIIFKINASRFPKIILENLDV